MASPVTLQTVADAAGVSAKTVSRVVNGDRHVNADTRSRIERAIAKLGYRPNLAARSLATARSHMLAIVSPHLRGFYYSELHAAALTACKARGYHLLIEEYNRTDPSASLSALETSLRQMRLEGVILAPPLCDDPNVLDIVDRLWLRCTRISPARDISRTDAVSANQEQGLTALARHLTAIGHRRIGIIASPSAVPSENRHEMLTNALLTLGVSRDGILIETIDWDGPVTRSAREATARFLAASPRPTAIFAPSDAVAMPIIQYAFERGLRVPEDLSVAGCDDIDIAGAVWPPLTTIHQPVGQMGTEAVSLLLSPRSNATRHLTLEMPLVVRNSTGAPPAGMHEGSGSPPVLCGPQANSGNRRTS
jgi:LacI family transcriptional regulator